jgi:hypothetical protein
MEICGFTIASRERRLGALITSLEVDLASMGALWAKSILRVKQKNADGAHFLGEGLGRHDPSKAGKTRRKGASRTAID